jgi:hypothetical protein
MPWAFRPELILNLLLKNLFLALLGRIYLLADVSLDQIYRMVSYYVLVFWKLFLDHFYCLKFAVVAWLKLEHLGQTQIEPGGLILLFHFFQVVNGLIVLFFIYVTVGSEGINQVIKVLVIFCMDGGENLHGWLHSLLH